MSEKTERLIKKIKENCEILTELFGTADNPKWSLTEEEAKELERKQVATDEMATGEKYYEKERGLDIEDLTPEEE